MDVCGYKLDDFEVGDLRVHRAQPQPAFLHLRDKFLHKNSHRPLPLKSHTWSHKLPQLWENVSLNYWSYTSFYSLKTFLYLKVLGLFAIVMCTAYPARGLHCTFQVYRKLTHP